MSNDCPICRRPPGALFRSAAEIAAQLHERDRFFADRLDRRFSREELHDVTNVVLGSPAAILRCRACGVLIRDAAPGEEAFEDDRYDRPMLKRLHEAHVRAFRAKERDYRSLLPSGARVSEVGSYVGGFLTVAAEWGWSAIGSDIGRDAVRFCRSLGHDILRAHLRECGLDERSLDAVFVWNCFEQIEEPAELLAEARRILRDDRLLVLRVPDADFYAAAPTAVLAYNGLLGWPHRYGYGAASLRRLVERHGFAFTNILRRPVMRPLRDSMRIWARREEAALIGEANLGWIELAFSAARIHSAGNAQDHLRLRDPERF